MIIYKSSKKGFIDDVLDPHKGNRIADIIKVEFEKRIGKVNDGEYHAWQNSLRHMAAVIDTDDISDDATICVEYRLPYQNSRIDFIIAGRNEAGDENVIIVELKQWSAVTPLIEADLVRTVINGGERNVPHPSYQAWSYAITLREYNECVQNDGVLLYPCAFLHNYAPMRNDPVLDNTIYREIDKAPVFTGYDALKLRNSIVERVSLPDDGDVMRRIDYGKLRPSKSLQDVLTKLLDKEHENNEFVLIDSQKSIFEFIMTMIRRLRNETEEKKVFIISGGPGTGKSVLAINLLAAAIKDDKISAYVTKNSAPRNVYMTKLAQGSYKKVYIQSLFKSSGSFVESRNNEFDVLVVDEAHRLNEKSGLFSKGENQIKEIINAAKISIFFIDENQIVTAKDIGSITEICKHARNAKAKIYRSTLESQFRCNGSDGYLSFLDDVLEIEKKNYTFNPDDYDVRVYDDLNVMFSDIKRLNLIDGKARMLAGYCWNWISKDNHDSGPDIVIEDQNFSAYWNFSNTSTWAIDDDTVDQIGCIHTSQGLEFSYVGVIVGDDRRYKDGRVITDPSRRARTDASLRGIKVKGKEAILLKDKIIRDTYKTLLSRAMKGCFIYCTDKALSMYFKAMLTKNHHIYYDFTKALDRGIPVAENIIIK